MHIWLHPLLHVLGVDSSTSQWYYFWSAFGSGPVAWLFLPLVYLRHQNCHEPWCPRIGRHPVDGTPYKACRRHHPELRGKPTRGHMTRAFLAAKERKASDS